MVQSVFSDVERSPDWFATELASGETGRVNDAIDRIEAAGTVERLDAYDDLYAACRPVYDSDDGYVRQAVVRFLHAAYPHPELRLTPELQLPEEPTDVGGYTREDVVEPRSVLIEVLLRALGDDDGRVRRVAVDGLDHLAVVLDLAGLDAELRALVEELSDLRSEIPTEKREHVEEALRSADRRGFAGPF